jgi:hypothetical protein
VWSSVFARRLSFVEQKTSSMSAEPPIGITRPRSGSNASGAAVSSKRSTTCTASGATSRDRELVAAGRTRHADRERRRRQRAEGLLDRAETLPEPAQISVTVESCMPLQACRPP